MGIQTDRQADIFTEGIKDRWMESWTDRKTDGRTVGRIHRWKDNGCKDRQTDG